jgi:YbbR domain-containing protein
VRLPRFVVENWGLKLFSLALGLVISLAVRNEQRLSTTVAVRLLVSEPASLVNTGDLPPEVLVKLSGPWGTLQGLDTQALPPIELDLTRLPRGTSTVRIREEQLGLPPDIEVVSITPSILTVRLEAREKRTVPVKPVVRGLVPSGFRQGMVSVVPAEVEIEGPKREIREIASVRVAPLEVEGAREDVIATLPLEVPGRFTRIVGPARATVRVPVEELSAERVVRLRVASPAGPVPVRAVLRGPKTVLDGLDEAALEATPAAGQTRGLVPVRIEGLPSGVTVAEPAPTVRLRR